MRDDARVTRRTGLIASGIASVLLLLAMAPADQRMMDTGGPGIIPFEVTGGQDRAEEIMDEWGEKGQDAARESLWIDMAYLVAYGVFFTLAAAATRDFARSRRWERMARIGVAVVYFAALSAAFDAFENTCLLLTLDGAGSVFPLLATIFAAGKFLLLAVVIVYLVVGLGMRLRDRGPDSMPSEG
jgi:hypothetical protein